MKLSYPESYTERNWERKGRRVHPCLQPGGAGLAEDSLDARRPLASTLRPSLHPHTRSRGVWGGGVGLVR